MAITGSCHCGKTTFRIDGDIPEVLTRCTCSFCSRRGALVAYYRPDQFHMSNIAGYDANYQWNTKLVKHHFCPVCGIPTFSVRAGRKLGRRHAAHRRECATVR